MKIINNMLVEVSPAEEQNLREEYLNAEKRTNTRNFLGDSEYNIYRKHALR